MVDFRCKCILQIILSYNVKNILSIKHDYVEVPWPHFCKHVYFFFANNLRMEGDTVLILRWFSALYQYL